jgi:hypothetical protein
VDEIPVRMVRVELTDPADGSGGASSSMLRRTEGEIPFRVLCQGRRLHARMLEEGKEGLRSDQNVVSQQKCATGRCRRQNISLPLHILPLSRRMR